MPNSLIDRKVIIRGNDFVAQNTSATIVMIAANKKAISLKLDQPLNISGTMYRYVIAVPRLAKDNIDRFISDNNLGFSVTWVPEKNYNSSKPMDLSWWRGGVAAITDLYID